MAERKNTKSTPPAEPVNPDTPPAEPELEPVKIAPRYYNAERNEAGAHLPGVPLRDLTEQELAEMPGWLQRSVDASGMYFLTKPRAKPAEDTEG